MSDKNLFTYNELESSKVVVVAESKKESATMNKEVGLCSFNYQGKMLDYGLLNGEPVFNLNAVAGLLGITNPRMSIDTTNSNYVIKVDISVVSFAYNRKLNNRGELFLTEAGLYMFLMRSNNPKAEPFQLWVTKEVLPSIRKTGSYGIAPKLPQTYAEALRELADKVEKVAELEYKVAQDKPKVEYADKILSASNSVSFADFGRMLGSKGIKMGQNRLFALLKEQKYLMPNNEPYQKYVDCGYFELLPQSYNAGGKTITTYKTLITAKGQYYFTNKLIPKVKQ